MDPHETARALQEELEEAFRDLCPGPIIRVLQVGAPAELTPNQAFLVTLQAGSAEPVRAKLPASLAVGYLADEEAAVDEWRRWVRQTGRRLAG